MAINDVSLTAGMRGNLISLQGTVDLLNRTQDRLSTGKKVNTAIDNPLNYFAAKGLNSKAADLAGYKDGMSEAVQTIKAANAGITAIEGLLAQAKAVAATAKAGGAGDVSAITIDLASVTNGQTIRVGSNTFTAMADLQKTVDFAGLVVNDTVTIGSTQYTAVGKQQKIDFTLLSTGGTVTVGSTTFTAVAKQANIDFSTVTAGGTMTLGSTTYTAVGKYATISFASITQNDTITIGSTRYTGVAQQKNINLAGVTAGQTITIGNVEYVATNGTTGSTTQFDISGTAAEDVAALIAKASLTGATTADGVSLITLDATTSSQTLDLSGMTGATTTALHTKAATEFYITTGYGTTGSSGVARDNLITVAGLTGITTGASGIITLAATAANTISAGVITSSGSMAGATTRTAAAQQFLVTAGDTGTLAASTFIDTAALTASKSAGVVTLSAATSATTITINSSSSGITTSTAALGSNQFFIASGYSNTTVSTGIAATNFVTALATAGISSTSNTSTAGVITLDVGTSALTVTVNATTITKTDLALESGKFFISSGYGSTVTATTAAQNFVTAAGLASTASTTGGIVTLNVATSLGTVGTSGVATVGDTLTATQFYLGATATDATAASNLLSKINARAEVTASTSSTSTARITITDRSGSAAITGGSVSEKLSTFTTTVTQDSTDRIGYAAQYAGIMTQLDNLAADSSYKGVNLLTANSTLDVEFGTGTDKITIDGFDATARALLGKDPTASGNWASNTDIQTDLDALTVATNTLKQKSSDLSSNLSIINTRQDWVKLMVNAYTEGADKLTLADMNEEGANMLMLQTRQTLGTTALSMSAQAAQSVLRLFA